MHTHQSAVFRSGLQRLEDAAVVEHEHAGIGHEQLKTGYALMDQVVHLGKLSVGDVGDNAVECVVANCFAGSLPHPGIERLSQALALVLNGKVYECRRASECSSASA